MSRGVASLCLCSVALGQSVKAVSNLEGLRSFAKVIWVGGVVDRRYQILTAVGFTADKDFTAVKDFTADKDRVAFFCLSAVRLRFLPKCCNSVKCCNPPARKNLISGRGKGHQYKEPKQRNATPPKRKFESCYLEYPHTKTTKAKKRNTTRAKEFNTPAVREKKNLKFN